MSIFAPTTGRLTSLTHADSAGKAEVEYNFTYDAFDRIETYGEKRPQARTATNAAFAAIDKTYRYDRLDQVIEAGAESFSYAANGNRSANGYVTERDNRLARDPLFTYEYDREGNRTSRTAVAVTSNGPGTLNNARTTYQWDHQNRLTKVINHSATIAPDGTVSYTPADTSAYAYDVLGRRVAVTHTSGIDPTKNVAKVSVYDGSQVVWTAEAKSPAALEAPRRIQSMLWRPDIDQLLAIQDGPVGSDAAKLPVWTLTDPQGTVKDYLAKPPTAGAESGLVATRSYSAFGTPEPAQVWASRPEGDFTDVSGEGGFFYVGQEYDAETGLQYSRARYYDPRSREFIGQDPLGFVAGDTNLYRRVGNSPVNATDPSGLLGPAVVLYWAVGGAAAFANAYIWPKNIKMAVDIANGDPVDINDSPYSSQYRSELATRTATGVVVGTSVAVGVPVLARALPTSASGYYWAGAGIASHRLAVPLAEGVVEVASGYQGPGLFPSPGAVIDDAARFAWTPLRASASPRVLVQFGNRMVDTAPQLTDDAVDALRVVAPKGTGIINEAANFSQKTFKEAFSEGGKFAGKTIDDVANALRNGTMKPSDVPIEFFTRGSGQQLILNTRSAEALRRAGIPREQWVGSDVAGNFAALRRLAEQLQRNKLGPNGTPTVRPSGGGQ